MSGEHERTLREFARQAASFERPGSIFTAAGILDWICEHVAVGSSDLVLDVAGGTGALGRRLARRAALALVVDLTPEMLREGVRASAREEGANVIFVESDAGQLPLPDDQFDVVVTRFAVHHLPDPAQAVREMARVCKPSGRVSIVDMVSEPDESGDRHNELERLRDPSHMRALHEQELIALMLAGGISARRLSERVQRMPALPWLDQAKPSGEHRERILAALHAELAGGPPSGLHAKLDVEDELSIEQRWVLASGPLA